MSRPVRALLLLAALFILAGCQDLKSRALFGSLLEPDELRVGIVANAPPLAYKKDNALTGLETRFASGLAAAMGKPHRLVELPREELGPALKDKKIDIIMAGMTVAEAHKQKLVTTSPYLLSGQVTLVRLSDYKRLGNGIQHLTEPKVRLGVVAGGTADLWLKGLRPKGPIKRFPAVLDGVQSLIKSEIDVFISSLPANFYYASLYIDKGLTPGNIPLTKEELAWAVRPDDTKLHEAANSYLAELQKNGELQSMLDRAIPFYRNTAYSPKL